MPEQFIGSNVPPQDARSSVIELSSRRAAKVQSLAHYYAATDLRCRFAALMELADARLQEQREILTRARNQ